MLIILIHRKGGLGSLANLGGLNNLGNTQQAAQAAQAQIAMAFQQQLLRGRSHIFGKHLNSIKRNILTQLTSLI